MVVELNFLKEFEVGYSRVSLLDESKLLVYGLCKIGGYVIILVIVNDYV